MKVSFAVAVLLKAAYAVNLQETNEADFQLAETKTQEIAGFQIDSLGQEEELTLSVDELAEYQEDSEEEEQQDC